MSRRFTGTIALVAVLTLPALARPALAQEAATPATTRLDLTAGFDSAVAAVSPATTVRATDYRRPGVSPVMMSLYATTALVHALDAHSTFRALDSGGMEANPLVSDFASNRKAFTAFKAGVAAGLIYAGRGLERKSRLGAILAMSAANSAYAYLAYRNYQVARVMSERQR